jgi:hypothetical protein
VKKFILFSMIAMTGIAATAADLTVERFLAAFKRQAEKEGEGRVINRANLEAVFAKRDLNKDGILSEDEQAAARQAAEAAGKSAPGVLSPAEPTAPQPDPKPASSAGCVG